MLSAALYLLATVAAFLVFGSLGVGFGQKLQRKGIGENLEGGCAMIFGVAGAAITLWIINLLVHK